MTLGKANSAECQTVGTRQRRFFAECQNSKITAVSFTRRLTAVCRVSSFAECLALGKEMYSYAESPALGKRHRYREQDFVECPTKNTLKASSTRQRPGFR
jgi:hypothetical protein